MQSFAVRFLNCVAGVMVTASHNPKDDNGYKVYWDNGCQVFLFALLFYLISMESTFRFQRADVALFLLKIIPPHDSGIAAHIDAEQRPWDGVFEGAERVRESPLCLDRFKDTFEAYMSEIGRRYCFKREQNRQSTMKVVFTAMHGIGTPYTAEAFRRFDLPPFIPVVEQVDPDPEFSTVKFPNPEEKGALNLAMATADKCGADFIVANDPDADRLAVASRESLRALCSLG